MTPNLPLAQLQALKAAILAEPAVADLRAAGDMGSIAAFYNEPHATVSAWRGSVSRADLFSAMKVADFDTLTAGKRDAWRLLLDMGTIDARKANVRKAIPDIWGATEGDSILGSCVRPATKGEAVLGGTSKTTGTITALVLDFEGALSDSEIVAALLS